MHSRWLSLTALLLGSAVVLAQQPGAQPLPQAPAFDAAKLDAVLLNWEKAMSGVNSLHAKVERKAIDKVFATTEVFAGEAKYLKPNKASLWLQNQDPKKSQQFERLVRNGQIAYKWEPSKKEIHIHELPKAEQGQTTDDNFVSMLFGMNASEAKRRYVLELQPRAGDTYWDYIRVFPRDPQDKAEFTQAQLVLSAATHLPRRIWFEQPNGNETYWEFPQLATNLQIDPLQFAREFAEPTPPAGWQLKRVMPDPRMIRPQQQ